MKVELFKDILPVALGEPSGGGDVPQRRPDPAVHVGQGQVHLLLREELHAFALGEYPCSRSSPSNMSMTDRDVLASRRNASMAAHHNPSS